MIAGTVAFAGVIEAAWVLAASKVAPLIPVAVRAGLAADDGDVEGANASLGAGRTEVKKWLQNVGNLERGQLVKDIKSSGFNMVSPTKSPVQVFERGGMKIRLDPPQGKTPYNHMHLEYGENSYNNLLNPVHYKSQDAHIRIK